MAKLIDTPLKDNHHPIRIAARYSGLSAELIRAWEKRYQVVSPSRGKNGRRMYSNQDIEHLTLLANAVNTGRRIGDVSGLSTAQLAELLDKDKAASQKLEMKQQRQSTALVMEYFDVCMDAVNKFDTRSLILTLSNATDSLGTIFFIEDLINPLMLHIRDECRRGMLASVNRRWAFDIFSNHLTWLIAQHDDSERRLIVYAIEDDAELTALKAAATASFCNWNPTCFDVSSTPEEVAESSSIINARLLIIGCGTTSDHDHTPNRFRKIRELMPDLLIVVQTFGTPFKVVREVQAVACGSLQQLQLELERYEN